MAMLGEEGYWGGLRALIILRTLTILSTLITLSILSNRSILIILNTLSTLGG